MGDKERIQKILAADKPTLARVDAALNGVAESRDESGEDCRLITFTEAARILNLSRPTVYRLVVEGRLDVVPLCGVRRIRLGSVRRFAGV